MDKHQCSNRLDLDYQEADMAAAFAHGAVRSSPDHADLAFEGDVAG